MLILGLTVCYNAHNPCNIFVRDRLVQSRHVTKKAQEYLRDIPQFSKTACCEEYMKDNKHNNLHLAQKIGLNICVFVLGHYLFLEVHSFLRAFGKLFASRLVGYLWGDKFSRQMEAIVYTCLNL